MLREVPSNESEEALLATNIKAGCPCKDTQCQWHGKCYECVRLHRIGGEHLPECLQFLMKDLVKKLATVVELETSQILYDRECDRVQQKD